jgi:RimJ/RimL family protein N-acetyltransferase
MIIKTPRLELKIITMADVQAVFDTLNYKNTADMIYLFRWPITMDQAQDWARKATEGFQKQKDFMFIARHRETGAHIGCLGIHYCDDTSEKMETGYWVSEPMQGQGYASEMLKAAIAHIFDHFKAETVIAMTALDNAPSVRLLEKFGFKVIGTKEATRADGSIRVSNLLELKKAA